MYVCAHSLPPPPPVTSSVVCLGLCICRVSYEVVCRKGSLSPAPDSLSAVNVCARLFFCICPCSFCTPLSRPLVLSVCPRPYACGGISGLSSLSMQSRLVREGRAFPLPPPPPHLHSGVCAFLSLVGVWLRLCRFGHPFNRFSRPGNTPSTQYARTPPTTPCAGWWSRREWGTAAVSARTTIPSSSTQRTTLRTWPAATVCMGRFSI